MQKIMLASPLPNRTLSTRLDAYEWKVTAIADSRRQQAAISIAVLPLTNLNQDSADGYFADGLIDEIIRNLSIIERAHRRS